MNVCVTGARVCRRAYVADFRMKFPVAALKFSDLRNIFPISLHRELFSALFGIPDAAARIELVVIAASQGSVEGAGEIGRVPAPARPCRQARGDG